MSDPVIFKTSFVVRAHEKGDLQIHEDTQPFSTPWAVVYKSFLLVQENLSNQVRDRKRCPVRVLKSFGWARKHTPGDIISVEYTVTQNSEGDLHLHTRVRTFQNDWRGGYRGLLMIKAEVDRQIAERYNCPFHPTRVKREGLPEWAQQG